MIKKLLLVFFSLNLSCCAIAQGKWTQKADFGGTERSGAIGFAIGNKGYIGLGSAQKDFWEYDPEKDLWTQKADFGGATRSYSVGFVINGKGYIGTGITPVEKIKNKDDILKDFWEYDPAANKWTKKADFGGKARFRAAGFAIGNKGYIGTGYLGHWSDSYNPDFWEYDASTNKWKQLGNFSGLPVTGRADCVGFSIGDKGYLGLGGPQGDLFFPNFWEYDPSTDKWKSIKKFKGELGSGIVAFSINGKGYIGTGYSPDLRHHSKDVHSDFWEYDPSENKWTKKPDFAGSPREYAAGFAIGNKGYIGTGMKWVKDDKFGDTKDFWEWSEK